QPCTTSGPAVSMHPIAGVVRGIAGARPGVDRHEAACRPEQVPLVEVAVDEYLRLRALLHLSDLRHRPLDLVPRSPFAASSLESLAHQLVQARQPGGRLDVEYVEEFRDLPR